MTFHDLKAEVLSILDSAGKPGEALQKVCDLLHREKEHYDWVGYYLVDREQDRQLVLGPFAGAPTDHTKIGFGQGICGQAADTLEVFVIDDVNQQSNYLSCSPDVNSEYVAPVMWNGILVGELDLDSHAKAAFTDDDSSFLLWLSQVTADAVAGISGFADAQD